MPPDNEVESTEKKEILLDWDIDIYEKLSLIYPKAKYGPALETIRQTFDQNKACALFCKGKRCKFDRANWPKKHMAINGIYSTWITENILAMARPNTKNMISFNVIAQFKRNGIKSIINLQLPGEHASCGSGLEPSGFSYSPQTFMDNDIFFYNFGWPDWSFGGLDNVLDAVKVMQFALSQGKVAIHCHAGRGRTGLLIACYLVYANRITPWAAVHYIRRKRPSCLQTESQISFVQKFAQYLKHLCVIFSNNHSDDPTSCDFTLPQVLVRQEKILHGTELQKYRHIPKIIVTCCEQLLLLSSCSDYGISSGNKKQNIHSKSDKHCNQDRVSSAMVETEYDIDTVYQVELLKASLNTNVNGFEKLKKVTDPYVISKLMWDWLNGLKEPVLLAQDLPQMLKYTDNPKQGLHVLHKGARKTIEHLFTTIAKLGPLDDKVEQSLVQCMLSTLTHQNVMTEMEPLFNGNKRVIHQTSADGNLMKGKTAKKITYYFMHLLHLLRLQIRSEEECSKNIHAWEMCQSRENGTDMLAQRTK